MRVCAKKWGCSKIIVIRFARSLIFGMWLSFPKKILRKLYDWTIRWARHKYAPYALFGVAFAESSFFLIPPDILLIAMLVVSPLKWWKYASLTLLGSMLGGLFGYLIGWGFYEIIGAKIVEFYNLEDLISAIGARYNENGFWVVFTAAFTPIPYKLITISAGLFKTSIWTFLMASILGRGLRFFIVAGLLRIFGEKITKAIDKYFDVLSIIFTAALIGGFIAIKLLF